VRFLERAASGLDASAVCLGGIVTAAWDPSKIARAERGLSTIEGSNKGEHLDFKERARNPQS
jgi:hypothetical protein